MDAKLVRDYPSQDASSRMDRAENITITDVRVITGERFGVPDDVTVYELDALNENGQVRENITVIPSMLFENTKDLQYRHSFGVVGKYSLALAMDNEQAHEELVSAIRELREQVQGEIRDLKAKESRLLHAQAELSGL